jgi:hypothetical protein
MFKRILASSLKQVAEHPMLVRIAFLTWFVHTLASFWRFWYTFYVILEKNIDISSIDGTLWQYARAIFETALDHISFWLWFFLLLLGVIAYVVLYPIGHGMMVAYAQTESKSQSIKIALQRYFTITITEWILSVMTLWSWHLLALRYFYHWGILDNILIQIFIFLVGTFTLWLSFLYSYANVSAVTDTFKSSRPVEQAQETLKYSTKLAMSHPLTTLKFLILSIILEIRFFLTTFFVIAIPSFLIRVGLQLWLINSDSVVNIVLWTVWILLVASIYINSIIDAFFTVYWYKLYKELQDDKS